MSNPTTGNNAQFTNPFNILPDLQPGSNPILGASSQFRKPFDILPNPSLIKFNPTIGNIDPTRDFDILPNLKPGLNPTIGNIDPTQNFSTLFNPTLIKFNPTYRNAQQFAKPLQMGSFTTYDIVNNPNSESLPFPTPFTKTPLISTNGEALPSQYFTSWYYNPFQNSQFRFNFTGQSIASNIANVGQTLGAAVGGISDLASLASAVSLVPNFISTIGGGKFTTPYAALRLDQLNNSTSFLGLGGEEPGLLDFRSRIPSKLVNRNDGLATSKLSPTAEQYAEAAKSKQGAYSTFNLQLTYGWGLHDAPGADRSDFTARTDVATKWDNETKRWKSSKFEDKEVKSPFRGDKVNVIDFRKDQKLTQVYKWKSVTTGADSPIGAVTETDFTQDFIKFYFTGPKLQNGGPVDATDDILVFRAAITNLGDSFNANWTPVPLIGRADPNYHYTGYSRDLSLGFDVYATSRDELKFIWRKLNALAGYTAPEYRPENIALIAPWMRITIGDLFVQQPVVLNSLNFDYGTDTSWEINIEDDPENMQVPFKISVTTQFNMIMDHIPEKGGRFFTLAKQFDDFGKPKPGNDNWLSDAKDNSRLPIVSAEPVTDQEFITQRLDAGDTEG
jgi:hypothetical protein